MGHRRDSVLREIELEKNGIEADREATKLKKKGFIIEMQTGLGDEIRKNPNGVKIHKKTKKKKFSDWLKNIFTKF
jgi:hypothetical protein